MSLPPVMAWVQKCMMLWMLSIINAFILGGVFAQDVASIDASEVDLDLIKLKNSPQGQQRKSLRQVFFLVLLKKMETCLGEELGDDALKEAEVSYRNYLSSIDIAGCPDEFKRVFRRYVKLLNSFEDKDLHRVRTRPSKSLQEAEGDIIMVLLKYRLEPDVLMEEVNALLDDELEGKIIHNPTQVIDIVRFVRESLQEGKRTFPEERILLERE